MVLEFDTSGKLLRTMGKPGVAGSGPDRFTEPNAVLVAPDGSLFVAEGHTSDYKGHRRASSSSTRTASSSSNGAHPGPGPGQFGMPHCLAMDSKGNLYVGDRDNNRIQVFTQDGKFLGQFTQFGRPSGIVIDRNDIMYVTDSESKNKDGYGHQSGLEARRAHRQREGRRRHRLHSRHLSDAEPAPPAAAKASGPTARARSIAPRSGQKAVAEVREALEAPSG